MRNLARTCLVLSRWNIFTPLNAELESRNDELAHVFDLPHASDPFFVMFSEIPRVKSLSIKEKSLYRGKFLRELEDFDES